MEEDYKRTIKIFGVYPPHPKLLHDTAVKLLKSYYKRIQEQSSNESELIKNLKEQSPVSLMKGVAPFLRWEFFHKI